MASLVRELGDYFDATQIDQVDPQRSDGGSVQVKAGADMQFREPTEKNSVTADLRYEA